MQQITPSEIRQKSFRKSFRGYNTTEVDTFLYSLAYVWDKLTIQISEVIDDLDKSSKEVQRLQGVENAIMNTLNTSEATARTTVEQAQKEADLKLQEAKLEVEKMLQEAKRQAKAIEEDSIKRHHIAKEKMAREVETIQKLVQETEKYRDTLLQRLQYLTEDILTKEKIVKSSMQSLSVGANLRRDIQELDEHPLASSPIKHVPTQAAEVDPPLA